jgi:hypothetical protein
VETAWCVAEDKDQLTGPYDLIDEAGRPRQDEDPEDERRHVPRNGRHLRSGTMMGTAANNKLNPVNHSDGRASVTAPTRRCPAPFVEARGDDDEDSGCDRPTERIAMNADRRPGPVQGSPY